MKILGRQNESIMDLLNIIYDISRIIYFEDLRDLLKDKEFTPPENTLETLSEIRILMEERVELFSPEDSGYEDKNYINNFLYEFELFLQYIIFGYYSSGTNQMLTQLTYFFDCLLVLNKIVYRTIEANFNCDMEELRTENYEISKERDFFYDTPVWIEKNRVLSKKLNIKPRIYPSIRARWWREDWEKYIADRNNNLENEFAYYFGKRKYADYIVKSISLQVKDEKLRVDIDWELTESDYKDLEDLNKNSCNFKINEENVIIGLSLHRKYYRKCAFEFFGRILRLLRKLSKSGDSSAEEKLREIISKIDLTNAGSFLIENNFLNYLKEEDISLIIESGTLKPRGLEYIIQYYLTLEDVVILLIRLLNLFGNMKQDAMKAMMIQLFRGIIKRNSWSVTQNYSKIVMSMPFVAKNLFKILCIEMNIKDKELLHIDVLKDLEIGNSLDIEFFKREHLFKKLDKKFVSNYIKQNPSSKEKMFHFLPKSLFESELIKDFEEYNKKKRLLEKQQQKNLKKQSSTCPNCKNPILAVDKSCKICGFRTDHLRTQG